MLSIYTKSWGLFLAGAIAGCAPELAERAEHTTSQSFPLQIDDALGRASWRATRPSFDGLELRAAVRLADGRVLVAGGFDSLKNQESSNAEVFDPVAETWEKLPPMKYKRDRAHGFLLNDGRVLIVAGSYIDIDGLLKFAKHPEIFDTKLNAWTECEALDDDFLWSWRTAETLLPDGRLLVTGGYYTPLAYFFDTKSLTWSVAPPMKYPRINHSATLLADGRVLLAGGEGFSMDFMVEVPQLISEVFDPLTNQWAEAAPLNEAHSGHIAHLLADDRVILLDGQTTSVEIFDPLAAPNGLWLPGPSFSKNSIPSREEFSVVTLQDQRLLLIGGYAGEKVDVESLYFSPAAQEWTRAGKLRTSRVRASATPLQDGRILIAGGSSPDYLNGTKRPLRAAEFFVPNASVSSALPYEGDKAARHEATRLTDGRVLLMGWSADNKDSFIFSPDTNTFRKTSPMIMPRVHAGTTLLDDGRVMVVGGLPVVDTDTSHSVEFFDPTTEVWSAGPSTQGNFTTAVARRLADGQVLVANTFTAGLIQTFPERFDPQTNRWTTLNTLPLATWQDISALADGRAVLSGFQNSLFDAVLVTVDLKDATYEQVILPDFGAFGVSDMQPLVDGRLLVASYSTYSNVGIFDPFRQQWSVLGTMSNVPPMESLPNGDILWAGSFDSPAVTGIFDVNAELLTQIDSPYNAFEPDTDLITPLLDGRMLVTGPTAADGNSGAYLYGKSNGQPCLGSSECISGYCVDEYCCNEACDDSNSCNACAMYRGADTNGTCKELLQCTPYQCKQIDVKSDGQDATCTTDCLRAADCALEHVCNLQGKCVAPKNVDIDRGCATVPSKTPADRTAALVTLLGLIALRKRQRFTSQRRARS